MLGKYFASYMLFKKQFSYAKNNSRKLEQKKNYNTFVLNFRACKIRVRVTQKDIQYEHSPCKP